MKKISAILVFAIVATSAAFGLSKAPPKPLSERVEGAKMVFVGKLVNKEINGDWVQAVLIVEEPLKNAEGKKTIKVTWRKMLGNHLIYDAKEGARGIAILIDKHNDRFWLRDDKFEDLKKLEEVKKLLAQKD